MGDGRDRDTTSALERSQRGGEDVGGHGATIALGHARPSSAQHVLMCPYGAVEAAHDDDLLLVVILLA